MDNPSLANFYLNAAQKTNSLAVQLEVIFVSSRGSKFSTGSVPHLDISDG